MWRCCFLIAVLPLAVFSLYTPSDDVIELTAVNFKHRVLESDDIWLVEFYAPWCGHCKSLAPEWKKAATALKGIVKVGAVDMDQHQSVGAPYGIQGFPTIKVFGQNKNSPVDYPGARAAAGIVDAGLSHVSSMVRSRLSGGGGSSSGGGSGGSGGDDVVELTDSNFEEKVLKSEDMWLVEFFAPWCGHCKSLEPHWKKAATELKGKVKLGALDATVHRVIAGRYGVQGFPTIKMFPSGKDKEAVDYDGGRDASSIVTWAQDKVSEDIPPPEVVQLTNEDKLQKNCEGHQLCIVSVLPHILDCQSDCRNNYIGILKDMAVKYKKQLWGWVWAEAMAQSAVEEAVGIGGFGYPAMAAINSRKMKYALLKGSFSDKGINEFLRELSFGRGSTAPVKDAKLPKVIKSEPWDGKDGKFEEVDDIDLSDVVLDDLDTDKKDEL